MPKKYISLLFSYATILGGLLILSACGRQEGTHGSVRLAISSAPSNITRVTVTSSGPDIPAITTDLVLVNGLWTGVISDLSAGNDRSFVARAYNASSTLLYRGSTEHVSIVANQTAIVAITLQNIDGGDPFDNEAPVIDSLVASKATVEPGGVIQLTATAHDPNTGDTLTYAWTSPLGTFSAASKLNTNWTAPSSNGIVPITLTVTDQHNLATSVTLRVSVASNSGQGSAQIDIRFNAGPRISNISADPARINLGDSTAINVSASDSDSDPLSYSWEADCLGAFADASQASTTFTPSVLPVGSCNNCRLTVTISDGRGASTRGTVALCITATGSSEFPPVIVRSFQSSLRARANQTVTFEVVASDPQGGGLSFAWDSNIGQLGTAQSPTATSSRITWTAPDCLPNDTNPTITATVSNTQGQSTVKTFTVAGVRLCSGAGTLQLIAGQLGGSGYVDGAARGVARFNLGYSYSGVAPGAAYVAPGQLYIADSNNNCIRRLNMTSGEVTTFAGHPTRYRLDGTGTQAGFASPAGMAYDGQRYLYVADYSGNAIRRIDTQTAQVTTVAGVLGDYGSADGNSGAETRFRYPNGVALDGQGNLYVTDWDDHTVRRVVLSTGATTTVAGAAGAEGSVDGVGGLALFRNPSGIAYDGQGNLYVADTGNYAIRRIELATTRVTTFAGSLRNSGLTNGTGTNARFSYPIGLLYDGQGNLYVTDSYYYGYSGLVRQIAIATAQVTTIAGNSSYSSSYADGIGTAARFGASGHLAQDSAGHIYIPDASAHTIRRLTTVTADVTTIAGTPAAERSITNGVGTAVRFSGVSSLTFDGTDSLYIIDSNILRRLIITTGEATTFLGGNGYVIQDGTGANASFASPRGLSYDGRNALYLSDASTVRQVLLQTPQVLTLAGSATIQGSDDGIGSAARFNYPGRALADGQGNIYVPDNYTIRRVAAATGEVTTVVGSPGTSGYQDGIGRNARIGSVYDMVYDGQGNIYFIDNYRLRRLNLSTNEVTSLGSVYSNYYSAQLAWDPEGYLYFSGSYYSHVIQRLEIATNQLTTVLGDNVEYGVRLGPLSQARLNQPSSIAVVGPGELVIADTGDNVILLARGL